eukprot:8951583-Pyramimonas_sp.AAC.1
MQPDQAALQRIVPQTGLLGKMDPAQGSAFSVLEQQKAKYHVLAQLQPLAVNLAGGDCLSAQRSCLVLGNLASDKDLREAMLAHPVFEIVLLRTMMLVQNNDMMTAGAAAKVRSVGRSLQPRSGL